MPTVQTAGLSAQEIADRQQIFAVWIKYWDAGSLIFHVPAAKRRSLLTDVSVESQVPDLLTGVLSFEAEGLENYGSMGHRPYWGPPINGRNTAIMGDCMDTSRAGREVIKTGQLLTVGVSRDNTRGIFSRGADLKWRVSGLEVLPDTPC